MKKCQIWKDSLCRWTLSNTNNNKLCTRSQERNYWFANRLCARLWLSSKCPQTAYRPMMMVHIYFHTSIFISHWDKARTLTLSFFLSVFTKNSLFAKISFSKTRNLSQKIYGNRQKKIAGLCPAPSPHGAAVLPRWVLSGCRGTGQP